MLTPIPEALLEVIERLKRMPSVEQVKRQQALDIIKAYGSKEVSNVNPDRS